MVVANGGRQIGILALTAVLQQPRGFSPHLKGPLN